MGQNARGVKFQGRVVMGRDVHGAGCDLANCLGSVQTMNYLGLDGIQNISHPGLKEPQAMNYAALDEVSDHELLCS